MIVGSLVVAELELCWSEIQARHPSVPEVTISLAFVKRTLGMCSGQHVIVTFDAVKAGGETPVGVLLHEAVHQSLRVEGARDWHLHRGTFRKRAIRLGLSDVDVHPRWGAVDLTDTTRGRYLPNIRNLDIASECAA